LVDRKIFQKQGKLCAALAAGEQTVIGVERIELDGFKPPLKAIFQEMRAAFIKKHAAFLIDERLQKLELWFRKLHLSGYRSHSGCVRRSVGLHPRQAGHSCYFARATVSAASSSRLYSGRCKSLLMSNKMMSRPLSFPTPVT